MIMSGNEAWNRNVFKRWRKVDRDGADITLSGRLLQMVGPFTVGGRAFPVADGKQLQGRHQQTIGPSRAEGTSTRQIGDTNQLTLHHPSPPHSFIPGLKPSFSANPSHHSLLFLLLDDYADSPDCLSIIVRISVFLFSTFLVVGSVR